MIPITHDVCYLFIYRYRNQGGIKMNCGESNEYDDEEKMMME
jgi:hypothetical protein